VERKSQGRWSTPVQEIIILRRSILYGHSEPRSLVSRIVRVAAYGANGRLEMLFKDSRVPQGIVEGIVDDGCVSGDEVLVPFWIFASRDHGYRLSLVEVLLPESEVNQKAEVVPCQHACQAGADYMWIWRVNVLVWLLVDVQMGCLSFLVEEGGVCLFVNIFEEHWKLEAFRQDRVALCDDEIRNSGLIVEDEIS